MQQKNIKEQIRTDKIITTTTKEEKEEKFAVVAVAAAVFFFRIKKPHIFAWRCGLHSLHRPKCNGHLRISNGHWEISNEHWGEMQRAFGRDESSFLNKTWDNPCSNSPNGHFEINAK